MLWFLSIDRHALFTDFRLQEHFHRYCFLQNILRCQFFLKRSLQKKLKTEVETYDMKMVITEIEKLVWLNMSGDYRMGENMNNTIHPNNKV